MRTIRLLSICVTALLLCSVAQSSPIPDFRFPEKTFFKQSVSEKNGRKVFAWYMICFGPFSCGKDAPVETLVEGYKIEILMAKSMGIDGFALNMMKSNAVYERNAAAMFQAGHEIAPDFKLFFILNNALPPKSPVNYVWLMKQYYKDPSYFNVQGKPLVCAYGADNGIKPASNAVKWWSETVISPLADAGINIYFVPTTFGQFAAPKSLWYSDEASALEVAGWGNVADGQSMWQMHRSPFNGGIKSLENFASCLHAAGKSYMAPMTVHYTGGFRSIPSWYWKPGQPEKPANSKPDVTAYAKGVCSNSDVCVYAGGLGLEAQWKSVIQVQKPEWVMMTTWNDFAESYIVPIDDLVKYVPYAQAPLGWFKPQVGMDELNRYYIQWYKTGEEPTITSDSLFYSYRTHRSNLIAKMDNRTPPKIVAGPTGDDIYITTALTAPARLQVVSGAVTTQYNLPAGLNQTTVIPFQVGSQSFSLWRDGVKIAATDGEPVVDSIDFYDYWPTTGYVETPQSH